MERIKSISRSQSSTPSRSSPRVLPESHIIQNRYQSYYRAEDFIKHLNKKYNENITSSGLYDEAYYKSYKFKLQEPQELSLFKVSQFPKAIVNQELLEQQDIINAFNHISSESRPRSKSRPRSTVPAQRRSKTEKTSFFCQKTKVFLSEKCEKCYKKICVCPKIIKDIFLKTILKKHLKALQKVNSINLYGKVRKSEYIVENKEKSFPIRSRTADESGLNSVNSKHKATRKFLKTPETKTGATKSLLDQSIRIFPLNLSQRKARRQHKHFN